MLGNWFNQGEGPEQHIPADPILISYQFSFLYFLEEPMRMRVESAQWYRIHKKFSRLISRTVTISIAKFHSFYCSFCPSRRGRMRQKHNPRDPAALPQYHEELPIPSGMALEFKSMFPFLWTFFASCVIFQGSKTTCFPSTLLIGHC